jgi:hypothetical protein
MTESAKLRLPYIAASQAQKHVTHNEALTLLDTLCQASVKDKDLTTPPVSPSEGDCYIVAATGTGAWTGWDNRIARYIDGEWRSYLPGAGDGEGWLVYVQDEANLYVLVGGTWTLFASSAQPLDADLTDIAALSPSNDDVIQRKAGVWTKRTMAQLIADLEALGTTFQPLDADLTDIAALSPSNDDVIQRKAGAWTNRTMAQLMADPGALGQIPFPATQNSSADPNTLDDYEEGTWTPVFSSSPAPSGVTYTTQQGHYTKIGNIVTCFVNLVLTSKGTGGGGSARFTGLPFTSAALATPAFGQASGISNVTLSSGRTWIYLSVSPNTTLATFAECGSGAAVANVTWGNCSDTTRVTGCFTYMV